MRQLCPSFACQEESYFRNFESTLPLRFSILKRTYQIKPCCTLWGMQKYWVSIQFIKFVRLETLVVSSVFVNSVLHILISMLQERSGSFTESICARYVSNNKWGHARKISFPCIFFFNISFYMSSVM